MEKINGNGSRDSVRNGRVRAIKASELLTGSTAVPIGLVAGLIVSICIGAFWFGSCYQAVYGKVAANEQQIRENREAIREINDVKCALARIEAQLKEIARQTETAKTTHE